MNYEQTEAELKEHLKEQIQFLLNSATSFDNGETSEAKRIAVRIRVLLHDTKNSTSLLSNLNRKDILFYDTALDYRKFKLAILGIRIGKEKTGFWAPLDNGPPIRYLKGKVPFIQWWNTIILVDQENNEFSRKKLVLSVANQDGGAHIDKKLSIIYANLTRNENLGWLFTSNGKTKKTYPALVSIRQICHEVLKSLKDEFPEYFI